MPSAWPGLSTTWLDSRSIRVNSRERQHSSTAVCIYFRRSATWNWIAQSTHGTWPRSIGMGDDESAVRCFELVSTCLCSSVTTGRRRCTTLPGLPVGSLRPSMAGATSPRGCHSFDGCRCRPGSQPVSPPPRTSSYVTTPRSQRVGSVQLTDCRSSRWWTAGVSTRSRTRRPAPGRRADGARAGRQAGDQLAGVELELDRVLAYAEDRSNRHSRNR